jgi:uncharacterized repeat protein (TIGR03843 family)
MTGRMTEPANAPSRADEVAVLTHGEIELKGRILPASNLTFFGEVTLDRRSVRCVYKPVTGERSLWDFPDGTLAAREVAAYTVSEALGWNVVPLTVLRDGPVGVGMVQVWREPDPAQDPVDIVPTGAVPPGFRHVLDAVDGDERPVSLVHEDSAPLRRMAVFDAVVNNADRKGGHVLPMVDGHRYGVDHGVTFHVDNKLRTVLWGWADEPLHPSDVAPLTTFSAALDDEGSALLGDLRRLLDPAEIESLRRRCRRLLSKGRMPLPSGQWPSIPWPAF